MSESRALIAIFRVNVVHSKGFILYVLFVTNDLVIFISFDPSSLEIMSLAHGEQTDKEALNCRRALSLIRSTELHFCIEITFSTSIMF